MKNRNASYLKPGLSPSLRLFKVSSIALLFTLVAIPIGYFSRILLARSLSPEMYGLFYSILAFFTFLSAFNDFGLGYSVSYLTPKFIKEKKYSMAWLTYKYDQVVEVSTSIALMLIVFSLSGWLATNYFKATTAQPVLIGFSLFFIAQSIISAYHKFFIGLQKAKLYSFLEYAQQVLNLVGILVVLLLGISSAPRYAWVWSISAILTAVIGRVLLQRFNKYLISSFKWDVSLWKQMFEYAVPTLLNTSLGFIVRVADTFFLTLFSGLLTVGQYNVIIPIVGVTKIILSPLLVGILPAVSDVADQPQKLSSLVERILRVVALISTYFCLFIVLFPENLIQVMFGDNWTGQMELELRILAISFIVTMLSGYLGGIIDGLGLVKEKLRISVIIALLTLGGGVILIREYGLLGAVLNATIIYSFSLLANLYLIRTKVPFSFPLGFYLKLALFSVIIFVLVRNMALNPQGLIQILVSGVLYSLIFLIFTLLQKEFKKDLKQMLLIIQPYVKWIPTVFSQKGSHE